MFFVDFSNNTKTNAFAIVALALYILFQIQVIINAKCVENRTIQKTIFKFICSDLVLVHK